MVHRPNRLVELLGTMSKWKLEPKRIRFVHPHADAEANMVLIEAVQGCQALGKAAASPYCVSTTAAVQPEIMKIYYGQEGGDV